MRLRDGCAFGCGTSPCFCQGPSRCSRVCVTPLPGQEKEGIIILFHHSGRTARGKEKLRRSSYALCTREVTVQVPDGLHHQTAARFIQTANRFTSVVRVVYGDNNVNAKSLLGVLSLSIGAGTRITITADGADAGEALDALEQCLAGA